MSDRCESPFSSIESTGSSLDMSRCRRMLHSSFGIRRKPAPIHVHGDPRIGNGSRLFSCRICGVEFRNNFALSGHFNVHRRKRRRSPSPAATSIQLPPEASSLAVTPTPDPPTPADIPPGAVRLDEDLWLLPGPHTGTVRPGPGPVSAIKGSNRLPPPVAPMCNCARNLLAMGRRASVRREREATEARFTATASRPPSRPPVLTRAVRMAALARVLKLTPLARAPVVRPMTTNNGPLPPLPDGAHPTPITSPPPSRPRIISEVQATRRAVDGDNRAKPRALWAHGPIAANIGPTTLPFGLQRRMLVPGRAHGLLLSGHVAANNSLPLPPPGFGQTTAQSYGPAITHGMQGPRPVFAHNGPSRLPSLAAVASAQAGPASGSMLTLEARPIRPSSHRSGHGLLIQRQAVIGESSSPGCNPPVDWLRLASRRGKDDEDLSGTTISDPVIRALHDQDGQEAEKLNLNLELGLSGCQK